MWLSWVPTFLENLAANYVAGAFGPTSMVGISIALAVVVWAVIGWHRRQRAANKPGMASWQFISICFAVAAIAFGAYGLGVTRSTSAAATDRPPKTVDADTLAEVQTLFNASIKPAGGAESTLLSRAVSLMSEQPDKAIFAGLIQRAVIDDERTNFSRLSNAITGAEIVDSADLQERLGAYYRSYQAGRTYIFITMKSGPDLGREAAFKIWQSADQKMISDLQRFSASPKYTRLLREVNAVGWGEGTSPTLSIDQRQFRVGLKQFSLTCVPNLANAQGRVFSQLKAKEAELSKGSPYSVALYFFIHSGMSSFDSVERVKTLAERDIETINIDELQMAIRSFFSEYGWRQSAIANLNEIVKSEWTSSEAGQRWFAIDNECRVELQKLKIWPEAEKILRRIDENDMATGGNRLWEKQLKVNYPQ